MQVLVPVVYRMLTKEMKKTFEIVAKTIFLVALSPIIILSFAGNLATNIANAMADSIDHVITFTKESVLG